jgi:hypothetical protein
MDLYIHTPYVFMAQCLISYAQGQLYLYLQLSAEITDNRFKFHGFKDY